MNKFKGIIFDVDGTIAQTNELIFASFNHVTEKFIGKRYTDEEITALFGPTEDQILKEWMKENYQEAQKTYYRYYSENHDSMASIFTGMKDLIEGLKKSGLLLGIFTGKGEKSAKITLRKLEVLDYFDYIATGDNVANHKPAPDGIIDFLNHTGLAKEEALMIGDAPSDIKASEKAGVKVASVLWDSYAAEEVEKMNPDYKFYEVSELSDFLLNGISR